jgi:hypothetical protein
MTVTKQPPVSLRIPADLRAAVEKFAEAQKMTRNAAYVNLLWRALNTEAPRGPIGETHVVLAEGKPEPATYYMTDISERREPASARLDIQLGPSRPKPGAMLIDKKRRR